MLNHFNYRRVDKDTILLTNDFGRHAFLSNKQFMELLTDEKALDKETRVMLRDRFFLLQPFDIYSDTIATRLRDMKNYVFSATSLLIFVVTNSCNHRCVYCQAQADGKPGGHFMTFDIGKKAVDVAMQSPEKVLSFEFQGGEPLLNFPVIKGIIEYAEESKRDKDIRYTIVSNLSFLTDEILDFLIEHRVSISASLDGPRELHDRNRQHLGGQSSYDLLRAGLALIRKKGYEVDAIQTTTRYSLKLARQIVQEYNELGMRGIFIRPLTPLGFARDEWDDIGYSPDEFLSFYKDAFAEILRINGAGKRFPELHATYFLKKILHGYAYNYMELRSPCGAGIGQMAYYYDGKVYTCDEARMVAEAGDDAFCIGNVQTGTYRKMISSKTCIAACASSTLETIPGCCDCVYQPYCGVCPVINFASDGDIFAKSPHSYRCKIYQGMLDYLFKLVRKSNPETMKILHSWLEEKDDENC